MTPAEVAGTPIWRSRSWRVSIALLGALLACGPASEAEPAPPPPEEAPLPEPTGAPGAMAGTWWALAHDMPYRALRITLTATDDPDAWEGSWISFDWRGTSNSEALARASRAVAVSVRREGDSLVFTGPSPQVDESGAPNGDVGRWELRVLRVTPPGEPEGYAGSMIHTDYTPTGGVAMELLPAFQEWSS